MNAVSKISAAKLGAPWCASCEEHDCGCDPTPDAEPYDARTWREIAEDERRGWVPLIEVRVA